MYTQTFDQSEKDKHAKICSETFDGTGSSRHSDSNPEVIDGSGSNIGSERQIDVITTGEKSDENNYSDTHINSTESISASARRSSSSSSSESSSNDFFQMDSFNFSTSGAKKSEKNDVYGKSSAKSEFDNCSPAPTSTCQLYNVTHNQMGMAPTLSPPVQMMDRTGGYDPSRIPSSVFEGSTNPLDWSIASNDSLFSLHLGNYSFSRESFLFSELGMSEELTKSSELNMFSRTPSIILEEIDNVGKSVEVGHLQTMEMSDETWKLEERLNEDQNEIKNSHQATNCKSPSVSSLSPRSGTSGHSFAFPILTQVERDSSVRSDFPRQQSYKQASEVSSSKSTSNCCHCFRCKQASRVISNSTAHCCHWFKCFSCPSCRWQSCRRCNCCC